MAASVFNVQQYKGCSAIKTQQDTSAYKGAAGKLRWCNAHTSQRRSAAEGEGAAEAASAQQFMKNWTHRPHVGPGRSQCSRACLRAPTRGVARGATVLQRTSKWQALWKAGQASLKHLADNTNPQVPRLQTCNKSASTTDPELQPETNQQYYLSSKTFSERTHRRVEGVQVLGCNRRLEMGCHQTELAQNLPLRRIKTITNSAP